MGKIITLLLLTLSLYGRTSNYQSTLEEVRIALMDVRKDYHEQKIALDLLKDQLGKQSNDQLALRIDEIEKTQKKILSDLRQISGQATQSSNALAVLEKQVEKTQGRINEIAKLKSTLTSISQAMGTSGHLHKVKSGESLDKIARNYNTTVADLKRVNGLTSNTIIIGQELKIPQ